MRGCQSRGEECFIGKEAQAAAIGGLRTKDGSKITSATRDVILKGRLERGFYQEEGKRTAAYISFLLRNCFVNSYVNSIRILCGLLLRSRSRVTMMWR